MITPMQKRRELEKIYHGYNDLSHPDADFNPARNKAVVEETIREATKYHQTVGGLIDEALGERIDAVSTYFTYRLNRGTMAPKDYFGKQLMKKYTGERLMSKLRALKAAEKLGKKTERFSPL